MLAKEVEAKIRRAFEIDKVIPFPRPKDAQCLLGKMVIISDNDRSVEDMQADAEHRVALTSEDWQLWSMVMFDWMPKLVGVQRYVVKYRCRGMGWKRIARTLYEKELTHRTLDRTTLWRIFSQGLDSFVNKG